MQWRYIPATGRIFLSRVKNFLLIDDLWIALMEGNPIQRSYNHIAFQVEEKDLPYFADKISFLELELATSRSRKPEEGKSIYFYDYDNHLFELHAGNLQDRMRYYLSAQKLSETTSSDNM